MQRHYIQQHILKVLLKKTEASFTELNISGITNDHLTFHIKQLLRENLVEKIDAKYKLTIKGTEIAGRIDINTSNTIEQPKVSITLGVFRNDDSEVLVLKRDRLQSLGKYSWLDRKWRLGNSIENEIKTLLAQEAGLIADNFNFLGATHVIRVKNGDLEIDVVLLNFKISDPQGELKHFSDDGENIWFKIDEIKKIDKNSKVVGFDERLNAYLDNKIMFQEFITTY